MGEQFPLLTLQSDIGRRLTIEEAAEFLTVSVSKLRCLVKSNMIPAYKVGKRYYFLIQHLKLYLVSALNEKIKEINKNYLALADNFHEEKKGGNYEKLNG